MTYGTINDIEIKLVLDMLEIDYTYSSTHLHLIVDGVSTDGWKAYLTGNYVVDFSGKGRSSGPPFAFVKHYLQYNDQETFKRFNENFGLGISSESQKQESQQLIKKSKKTLTYFNHW